MEKKSLKKKSKEHLKNISNSQFYDTKIDYNSNCSTHFSFNFTYLTNNKSYNFSFLKQNAKLGEFAKRLFNTIEKISSISTQAFSSCGIFSDSLCFREIKSKYKNSLSILDNEKIFSITLASKHHERMIIYKENTLETKISYMFLCLILTSLLIIMEISNS